MGTGMLKRDRALEINGTALNTTSTLEIVQEDGTIINSMFQVADVVRPLHSASQICDGTEEKHHEVLFTREAAHVVPEGTLSRLLATINVIAKYPRRGGLYVAKMKAKDPKAAKTSGFGRPGNRRWGPSTRPPRMPVRPRSTN